METLNNIVLTIQNYMSNIVLIIALAAAGIWFSIRTGFIQVRGFKRVTGGPVYYIRAAFKGVFGKILAGIFAVLLIFALGFMGNAVQSNSIAASFHTAFGIPQWVMGLIVAVLAVFIFSGGMKRIAKVTETMVPLMAALYIVGSLIVIFCNWRNIPLAFYEIFVGAFAPLSLIHI